VTGGEITLVCGSIVAAGTAGTDTTDGGARVGGSPVDNGGAGTAGLIIVDEYR